MSIKLNPHFQDADAFYEQLIDAHGGLNRDDAELFNARLILVLANQIGDARVLKDCIDAARLPAPAASAAGTE